MAEPTFNAVCQACNSDADVYLRNAPGGLVLRHCDVCRLTSVVDPVTTAVYDAEYVAQRYDSYETTERMSHLRLDFVELVYRLFDLMPQGLLRGDLRQESLLDVGYGNGSFIRAARKHQGWSAYGNDVNTAPYRGVRPVLLPNPMLTKDRYTVITFFDSLEHFEQLHQVRRVSACTDWLFVTAPLPPHGWPACPQPWAWKHWRPGEHHHMIQPKTLEHLFTWEDRVAGIRTVATLMHVSHFEDSIRGTGPDGRPNVFTAALRCTTFRG